MAVATAYEVHPLAELIPAMSDAEYRELREDIEVNGLRQPITLYEGKVLDGRHRARACEELGIEPTVFDYEGDEPAAYVLSLNVKRRNLSSSQRAALAVEFLPQLEEEAKRRQGTRTDLSTSGSPDPEVPKDPHRARNEAGVLVGVSGSQVDRARRVKRKAPEKFEQIKKGGMKVKTADNELRAEAEAKSLITREPFALDSKRNRQIAAKAKGRVGNAISRLDGLTAALGEADLTRAIAAASDDEIAHWQSVARRSSKVLSAFQRKLKGAGR